MGAGGAGHWGVGTPVFYSLVAGPTMTPCLPRRNRGASTPCSTAALLLPAWSPRRMARHRALSCQPTVGVWS